MSITVPGKILVIDNIWEHVNEMIESFWEARDGIVYLRDIPDENTCPSNVRLLVLDLVLREDGELEDTDFEQAALALTRVESRTNFYLVALWSVHIDSSRPDEVASVIERLKEAYCRQTGEDLPGRILNAFGKDIGQEKVVEEIHQWISENPEAGIVFEWEKAIEGARDKTVSEIVNIAGIRAVVKTLEKEVGRAATPREILTLFNRVLLRHSARENGELTSVVMRVLEEPSAPEGKTLEWYARVHYLAAYFTLELTESLWTGDIFRTNIESDPEKEYAISITPACDFTQKRVKRMNVAYGTKVQIIQSYRRDAAEVPIVVKKFGKDREGKHKGKSVIVQAIAKGTGLPGKLCVLHFLRDSPEAENYFHLLIDFSMVEAVNIEQDRDGNLKIPNGWQRICRLDSPYLEDLLQKYASFAARIGTPELPEHVIKEELEKLKSSTS